MEKRKRSVCDAGQPVSRQTSLDEKKVRLFVALPLPKDIRQQVLEAMKQWKKQGMKGRWCPENNLHVTLAFLGEQPQNTITKVEEILQAMPFEPAELSIHHTGCFGSLLYADLGSSPGLNSLESYVGRLRQALQEAGIEVDSKPFRPHITLVRRMEKPAALVPEIEVLPFWVRHCCLYRSILSSRGPVYQVLYMTVPAAEAVRIE